MSSRRREARAREELRGEGNGLPGSLFARRFSSNVGVTGASIVHVAGSPVGPPSPGSPPPSPFPPPSTRSFADQSDPERDRRRSSTRLPRRSGAMMKSACDRGTPRSYIFVASSCRYVSPYGEAVLTTIVARARFRRR
jgi:hypothetical protein